jgi:hypothetical protein
MGRAASAGKVVMAIKNAARSDRRISFSFQLERQKVLIGKTLQSRQKFLLADDETSLGLRFIHSRDWPPGGNQLRPSTVSDLGT